MSITELHQLEEREFFLKMIDLTRKGEFTDGVFRHIKKDGEKIFVETHTVAAPIFGKNARNILIQDITKRKESENAIKTSLSLLNASLESTADGILVVDTEGRASIYNHKFAQMWNVPEDILVSGLDEQMLRYVLTQIDNPEEFLSNVSYLYKSPELSGIDEIELIDGRIFERYSIPQWIGDSIVGRVWSFRDITERKQAEKYLRDKMDEMSRLHNLTIGRELTMIELKKEVNKLLLKAGQIEKYRIVE
jgi:PAS domain-containing protein